MHLNQQVTIMAAPYYLNRLLAFASLLCALPAAQADSTGFITAPNRNDVAYDVANHTLYISGTDQVRRYDMASGSFLTPIQIGGVTAGMDISPDGKTLAIANYQQGPDSNFVDFVNLTNGSVTRQDIPYSGTEGGTFTVAYDSQGKLLVSTTAYGPYQTILRQLDTSSGTSTSLGQVWASSMLSASADHQVIAIAEPLVSGGRWGYYQAGAGSYIAQHPGAGDRFDFNSEGFSFEIAASSNGSQLTIPTSGGTFISDANGLRHLVGQYGGPTPIGAAYSPLNDDIFLPFSGTDYVAEYDSNTLQEVNRFVADGHSFEWQRNSAFAEGRTKVAADGSYFFTTLDNGIFFGSLTPVPEPGMWVQLALGLGLLASHASRRIRRIQSA